MAIFSNGKDPVFISENMQIGERRWFFCAWDRKLLDAGDEVTLSEWSVPAGFNIIDTKVDVISQDPNTGDIFYRTNMALIECDSAADGDHLIENKITVSDGEVRDGPFYVPVKTY